jgi:splicing factor 3A subunit 1
MSSGEDVIYPPPDIKSVIDKTAEFVAKVGDDFERKVTQQQAGQPKFAFLNVGNPYRKYYEMRIQQLREGKDLSKPLMPKALQDLKAVEEEKRKKREERKMIADGLVKEYPPPPPTVFMLEHPYIAEIDREIITITAEFTARNGAKFLQGLSNREGSNPQFEFIRPEHYLHPYFQALVDSFTKILLLPAEEKAKIDEFLENRQAIIDRIQNRYHYMAQEEKRASDKQKLEEEKKEAMTRLDWYNFTIVGKVDFPEDESVRLEVPIDRRTGRRFIVGEPVPLSADLFLSSEQPQTEAQPEEEEIEMEMKEENPLPSIPTSVPIRTDYVRSKKSESSETYLKSPITGEMIRESDFSEHMRVVLLDPQWKKQSEIVLKRAREEASALAVDIGDNVAKFIKDRLDLFGDSKRPRQ